MKSFAIICLIALTMNSLTTATKQEGLPEYLAIVAEEKKAHD